MGTQEQLSVASGLTDLCRLAEHHGTDKLGVYTPFYDLLFRDRREKVLKVLEIGIGTLETMSHVPEYKPGASLRMWKDYFPSAEIYGLDKDLSAVLGISEERIFTWQADQSSEQSLENVMPSLALGGKFDLIVDDGSHKPEDQLLTFRILSRLLVPHGLYIIEDVSIPGPWLEIPHTEIRHWQNSKDPGHAILIRGEVIHHG